MLITYIAQFYLDSVITNHWIKSMQNEWLDSVAGHLEPLSERIMKAKLLAIQSPFYPTINNEYTFEVYPTNWVRL